MFDEKEHPRDDDGTFTDDDDGTFTDKETDGKYYRQNASYDEILKIGKRPDYSKYKNRIQSKVFDKISTVKKKLNVDGHCIITIYEFDKIYRVKLYGVEKDYDFEIIKVEPNE